jgi:hypothetical protein
MPTVLRFGRLRVVVYFNDHRPAHVHVIGNSCEAVFALGCPAGPVTILENYGFQRRDITRFEDLLANQLNTLCSAWEDIHGQT